MAILRRPIGPGKTPPRLIADLLDYVPNSRKDGFNLLADPAQQFRDEPLFRKNPNDCAHKLVMKENQTRAPKSENAEPSPSSQYFVAAICSSCRFHFTIIVTFEFKEHDEPCTLLKPDYPLHHLILTNAFRAQNIHSPSCKSKYTGLYEIFEYRCSAPKCPVVVNIKIHPPRLSNNLLRPIEDYATIENRGILEIKKDPIRFAGGTPANPLSAFEHLRSYLVDAMKTDSKTKKIAIRNKKYRLSFADDCQEIFEYLDFTFLQEGDGDDSNQFWRLPIVSDLNRNFLDDALLEVTIKATEQQLRVNHYPLLLNPVSPTNQIKAILGYIGCPERTRYFDGETEEHPYYSSLGAVEHFPDEFLSWAYDRQCDCDPINKPYYLDCLEDLAQGRKSDDLQTKVVMATSAGDYGLKALEEAYRYFGQHHYTRGSDELIMGLYKSRINSTPRQKDDARRCLQVIARHRNSQCLETLANEKTMNLDEALKFLGVSQETAPEFIEASAVAMFADGDKSKVALALQIIAKQKPGNMILQRAAATMASEIGELTLSVNDAYQRLQIPSNGISDEGVLNYFQSLCNDATDSSKEIFSEALRVIALERNSNFLLAKLDGSGAEVQANTIEPVGLDNIGNTCYLNSLLQYYYTVKPLREMVMNFDEYRMDLNDECLRKKKVGGRQVEKAEIIKAQKFVDELRKLFTSLKKSPARSVRPSKELAALTIFSTQAEQAARKNSVSSPSGGTNPCHTDDTAIIGPHWPTDWPTPLLNIAEDNVENIEHPNGNHIERSDNCSDITLVDVDPIPYSQNSDHEVYEVHLPLSNSEYKETAKKVMEVVDLDSNIDMINAISNEESIISPSMPERPPPVPPRNKSGLVISTTESKVIDPVDRLWDFGSQQDVTEVIGNVLFRLQCAITATGFEQPSGEQIDIIRESFFGANTVYTQKAHCLQKKVEAWSYLLVFPARSVPRSIYEALDVSFDEQIVEVDNLYVPQYTSISKLPRIMQFHIQRTAFDQENLRSWKNRTPVTIPETLYLDRYIDDSDNPDSTVMHRRRETWSWKRQLNALEARYYALTHAYSALIVPEALIAAQEWLNEIQELEIDGILINPELPDMLDERIAEIALELNEASGRIETLKQKLKNQFTDMREYEYKLHAVFIHHGEAGGGHYWVYIYDYEQDIWRQYNDEYVTEVRNRDFIFNHESVGGGTPYYVVYVRSSELKELVSPVCRDVQEDEINSAAQTLDGFSMPTGDMEFNEVRHIEHDNQDALQKPLSPSRNWGH